MNSQASPEYKISQQMTFYGRVIRLIAPVSGRHGRVTGWDYRAEDGRTLYAPLGRLRLYGAMLPPR